MEAKCERGSLTIAYPRELDIEGAHVKVASMLVESFVDHDYVTDHVDKGDNVWSARRVHGQLPDGSYAHVFVFGM